MKKALVVLFSISIFFISVSGSYADETSDIILELLIKKGIITQEEVDDLRAKVSAAKTAEDDKITEHVAKAGWAERIKLKGDIRLRSEYRRPGSGSYGQRFRVRARAGLEAKITDTVDAGIALSTGDTGVGSARSTNQTLSQAFSSKTVALDMVYIDWNPNKYLRVTGGKYKNPLYHPGDLLASLARSSSGN